MRGTLLRCGLNRRIHSSLVAGENSFMGRFRHKVSTPSHQTPRNHFILQVAEINGGSSQRLEVCHSFLASSLPSRSVLTFTALPFLTASCPSSKISLFRMPWWTPVFLMHSWLIHDHTFPAPSKSCPRTLKKETEFWVTLLQAVKWTSSLKQTHNHYRSPTMLL